MVLRRSATQNHMDSRTRRSGSSLCALMALLFYPSVRSLAGPSGSPRPAAALQAGNQTPAIETHLKGQRISDLRLWGEPRFERANADCVSPAHACCQSETLLNQDGPRAQCELRRTGRAEDFADGRPRRTTVRYHSFAGSPALASDGPEAGLRGLALREQRQPRGPRRRGRRWPGPPAPQSSAAAPPQAPPPLPLLSGRPIGLPPRPSRCTACLPTAPARSPAGSPADTPRASRSLASGAAPRTSGPFLPATSTPAPPASPGTKTALAPCPAPAAAPSPAQSPGSAPTAPAATDETPPPCPAGS